MARECLNNDVLDVIGNFIPAGIVVIGKENGKVSYVNQRAVELFGFNPSGLNFKDYAINMAKARKIETGPFLYEQLPLTKALRSGKTTHNEEITIQRPNQPELTLLANAMPLTDDAGNIIGALAIFEDITNRKKAEDALKQSEERFSKAFNISPAMLTIICVADNRYVNVNDSFLKLMGYRRDEVIGHTSRELKMFVDPDRRDRIVALALRQGSLRNQEIEIRTKSGEILNVLFSLEVITVKDEPHIIVNFIDITQRKRAEEALKESEHLYRTLFENTEEAFQLLEAIYDESGKANNFLLLKVNRAYERQTGLKASDVIGRLVTDYLPNLEPFWISFYAKVARTGEAEHTENYNANTNRWYDVYAFQYAKDQVGVLFRDVTERKKAEEALSYQANLLAQVHEAILGLDAKSRVVFWNKGAEEIFGWKAKEVMGKDTGPLLQNKIIGLTREAEVAKLIAAGHWEGEANYKHKDGHYITCDVRAAIIKDSEGKLTGIVTSLREITERKKAESAVKTQASLINLSPDAIIVRSLDGTISFWSKGAEKLYGYTKQEALGQSAHTLLKTIFPYPLSDINAQLRDRGRWEGELKHRTKDGKEAIVQSRWLFAKEEKAEEEASILESNIDITEQKKAERLALENARKLKDSERLATIGATAGMVGHDIRNPLQAIAGDVYLLKDTVGSISDAAARQEVEESLESIESNISYINKIVADLQDYARPLNPEYKDRIYLSDILVNLFEALTVPKKIQLSIDVQAFEFRTDPEFIRRVLTNLITNAIQAMPEGGTLKITGHVQDNRVIITVSDTGVGIPDEVKPKLFTPMMTTKAKGQGFGLAVSKRLIEAMKGTVTFESEKEKGTKFIIELPYS